MPHPWRELVGYGLGTLVAFAVDVATLALLREFLGVHYLLAAACGFTVGGIVLYVISIRWVFAVRRIEQPHIELPAFLALGLIGLLVQIAVMFVAVTYFAWFYLYAKLAAAAVTFVVNFLLRRSLLFRRPRAVPPTGVATDA